MKNKEITTYLNDHLAGSVAAVALLEDLSTRYSGQPLAAFLVELQREVKSDQNVLRKLLGDAEEKESKFRKIIAWIAGKLARAKFKTAGEGFGGVGLVQAFETLALGIRGKQLLWRALATSNWAVLHDVDLARLEQRAIEQQERVEQKRLAAAREAFANQ
jgi:hypothetical protein